MNKKTLFTCAVLCLMTVGVCAAFLFGSAAGKTNIVLTDIENSYAKSAIIELTSEKVMPVYFTEGEYRFFPDAYVSREYFAYVTIRFMGLDVSAYSDIPVYATDVDAVSENCLPYIKAALDNGVISMLYTADDKPAIAPGEPVTRAEAVYIISLMSPNAVSGSQIQSYSDWSEIDAEYLSAASLLVQYNILMGYPDNTLRLENPISHQELAEMLYRVMNCGAFYS